jgi:hypothetical protein
MASLLFLGLNLAGSFLILAPFLVSVRNALERSDLSRDLWPVISPDIVVELIANHSQMLATFAVSAIATYIIFILLKTLFAGGIYKIIVRGPESESIMPDNPVTAFFQDSARLWPGFIKASLFAMVVYGVAIFLGLTLGRIFSAFGLFWQILFTAFILLVGSTYLQFLKVKMATDGNTSLVEAISGTRPAIARWAPRIILGNISVAGAGVLLGLGLWHIIRWVRDDDQTAIAAIITILAEQLIVLIFCLMQVIRINFNQSIFKKGAQDALG